MYSYSEKHIISLINFQTPKIKTLRTMVFKNIKHAFDKWFDLQCMNFEEEIKRNNMLYRNDIFISHRREL